MNLTISSPLEAHKAHTLCFSLCGVDVGFENPIFAAIEARLVNLLCFEFANDIGFQVDDLFRLIMRTPIKCRR